MQRAKIIVALTIKEALKYITTNSEMGKCSLIRRLVRYTTTNRLRKQRWKVKRKEQRREERRNKQRKVNIKTQRYVGGRTK